MPRMNKPLSAVRRHMSYANVAATMALVFALTGGAVAATGHVGGGGTSPAKATASISRSDPGTSTSTAASNGTSGSSPAKAVSGPGTGSGSGTSLAIAAKSKGKTGPRGPAGPKGATGATGPAGPTGAAGPAGPVGPAGPAGAAGTDGTKGKKGANGKAGPEGPEGPAGKEGSPWTAGGTLPAGSTETGAWYVEFPTKTEAETFEATAISFPIPLAKTTHAVYVSLKKQTGKEVEADCTVEEEGKKVEGSAEDPVAQPGNLCLYEGHASPSSGRTPFVESFLRPGQTEEGFEAGTSGVVAEVTFPEGEAPEAAKIYGSWAVTAPTAP